MNEHILPLVAAFLIFCAAAGAGAGAADAGAATGAAARCAAERLGAMRAYRHAPRVYNVYVHCSSKTAPCYPS